MSKLFQCPGTILCTTFKFLMVIGTQILEFPWTGLGSEHLVHFHLFGAWQVSSVLFSLSNLPVEVLGHNHAVVVEVH